MKYLEVELYSKMNFLWSFIERHKQKKILILMATSQQVKYTYEAYNYYLNPGVSIMALFKGMNPLKRKRVYNTFCQQDHAVLLATDITVRGLEFSNVNWIVELDCPQDTNAYIQRASNIASYAENGESLLILLPSEKESMLELLKEKNVLIKQLDPLQCCDVQGQLREICVHCGLQNTAHEAFDAYLKNILLMEDKTVFELEKINFEMYAKSLGLKGTPRALTFNKYLKSESGMITGYTSYEYLLKCPTDSDSEEEMEEEGPSKYTKTEESAECSFDVDEELELHVLSIS